METNREFVDRICVGMHGLPDVIVGKVPGMAFPEPEKPHSGSVLHPRDLHVTENDKARPVLAWYITPRQACPLNTSLLFWEIFILLYYITYCIIFYMWWIWKQKFNLQTSLTVDTYVACPMLARHISGTCSALSTVLYKSDWPMHGFILLHAHRSGLGRRAYKNL